MLQNEQKPNNSIYIFHFGCSRKGQERFVYVCVWGGGGGGGGDIVSRTISES